MWATFADSNEPHDIIAFTATFELNGIPKCSIVLPMGRRTIDQQPATGHALTSSLRTTGGYASKVFVYIQVTTAQTPDAERWPTHPILVFEGYVTGVGYRKSRGQAQLVYHVRHWLIDLAYGSALSQHSHPSNPADFLMNSVHPIRGMGGALNPGAQASFLPYSLQINLSSDALEEDMWLHDEGILEWLLRISEEDQLDIERLETNLDVDLQDLDEPGTSMRRALLRMRGGLGYVPLRLDMENDAQLEQVADSIMRFLEVQSQASFSSVTMWDKLIRHFAPSLAFSIVPRVTSAYPIPFVAGLRWPWQYIKAHEYTVIDAGARLERVLLGVALMGTRNTFYGGNLNFGTPQERSLGGWFSPRGITDGMILMKNAPFWMNNLIMQDAYGARSINHGGPRGSSINPGAGVPPTRPLPVEFRDTQIDLMDRYAKTLYVWEMLKGRRGQIAGKLRFDIAPGSTVRVQGTSEHSLLGIMGTDAFTQDLFATVTSVTISVNGQNNTAGTSFQLDHLRSYTENFLPGHSLIRPPLWRDFWRGAPLVDDAVPGHRGLPMPAAANRVIAAGAGGPGALAAQQATAGDSDGAQNEFSIESPPASSPAGRPAGGGYNTDILEAQESFDDTVTDIEQGGGA